MTKEQQDAIETNIQCEKSLTVLGISNNDQPGFSEPLYVFGNVTNIPELTALGTTGFQRVFHIDPRLGTIKRESGK